MEEKKKNVYQKLAEIQRQIIGLGKDKQAFGYKYVTGDKILGLIKPIMVKEGLILKQEVLSIDNDIIDYSSKKGQQEQVNMSDDFIVLRKKEDDKREILTKVMMRFTWVDIDTGEKDINLFGANGQNGFDKGVGSALTYAERYFLLKYFHIATDEDDLDQPIDLPVLEDAKLKGCDKWTAEQKKSVINKYNLTTEQLAKLK